MAAVGENRFVDMRNALAVNPSSLLLTGDDKKASMAAYAHVWEDHTHPGMTRSIDGNDVRKAVEGYDVRRTCELTFINRFHQTYSNQRDYATFNIIFSRHNGGFQILAVLAKFRWAGYHIKPILIDSNLYTYYPEYRDLADLVYNVTGYSLSLYPTRKDALVFEPHHGIFAVQEEMPTPNHPFAEELTYCEQAKHKTVYLESINVLQDGEVCQVVKSKILECFGPKLHFNDLDAGGLKRSRDRLPAPAPAPAPKPSTLEEIRARKAEILRLLGQA